MRKYFTHIKKYFARPNDCLNKKPASAGFLFGAILVRVMTASGSWLGVSYHFSHVSMVAIAHRRAGIKAISPMSSRQIQVQSWLLCEVGERVRFPPVLRLAMWPPVLPGC